MTSGRQTAIGAFVLGGIVLGLAALLLFGNLRLFSRVTHAAIVFQDSISGLSIGAPVTFRGVRVGSVDGISLKFDTRTHVAYIPVTVVLEPERVQLMDDKDGSVPSLSSLIAHGLRAEVNTQSFVTGQANINLDFNPDTPAILHPGVSDLVEIPTRPSTIQRVTEQLSQLHFQELADNTNAALVSLKALSEKLHADLPPLIDSLKASSDRSDQAIGIAAQAVADLQNRLDVTLGHIDRLATDSDHQLQARGADLHDFLETSRRTVEQTRSLVANLSDLTAQRGQTRANLDATLRDLAATTASLRGFASDIEHNPQLLLTGRQP